MFRDTFKKLDEERTRFKEILFFLGELLLYILFTLSAISLVYQYGTYIDLKDLQNLSNLNFAIIFIFCICCIFGLLISKKPLDFFVNNKWVLLSLLLIFTNYVLLNVMLGTTIPLISKSTLLLLKLSVIISRLYQIFLFLTSKLHFNPFVVMILSFILVILIGTGSLLLPRAVPIGKSINIIDALFIATSSVCVTGLAVIEIGRDLSLLGQLVVLSLIQIGGLGLMTLMCFFTIAFGTGFGIRERVLMKDILSISNIGKISKLIVFILLMTLIIESIGAIFYYFSLDFGQNDSLLHKIYFSVFHSVSAFCNAGFSLYSNNFMDYRGNHLVNFTCCSLIVTGGLGFIVMYNMVSVFKRRILKRFMHVSDGYLPRFSVHTNLVLISTFLLIIIGATLFYYFELNYTLQGLTFTEKIVVSIFQSITPRTAGFNTVDMNNICNASLFMILILMFIGASPGSTGGGIKTSTFSILLLSIVSMLKNRENVEVFHRTIPRKSVNNAFLVIILSLISVGVSSMVLFWTEDFEFRRVIFEVVSAFGTVGLSTGITPLLTDAGKFALIALMFVGRIGPISMVVAMSHHGVPEKYGYPESEVMVG